jgi:hypothetical protein
LKPCSGPAAVDGTRCRSWICQFFPSVRGGPNGSIPTDVDAHRVQSSRNDRMATSADTQRYYPVLTPDFRGSRPVALDDESVRMSRSTMGLASQAVVLLPGNHTVAS